MGWDFFTTPSFKDQGLVAPIPPQSDIINGRKGVSVDFALRFEQCLGVSAQWLLRLQSFHDYCVAYHSKREAIAKDVRILASV